MINKKQMEIEISKLKDFTKPEFKLEQYITPSSIASSVLWDAYMDDLVEDKTVMDLGCGTGILGIGAALLGAKKIICVDKVHLREFEENINLYVIDYSFIEADLESNPNLPVVDLVITNPPFGVKTKGIDTVFLKKAMECSDHVYSFHKASTRDFLVKFIEKNGFQIDEEFKFKYPLRNKMEHHKSKLKYIDVICFKISRVYN